MSANPTATATAKQRLREQFRTARLALSDADYTARSTAICKQIATLPEIREAETVHVYWPLVERREIDTRPLIGALLAEGKSIVLPVVESFAGTPVLRHIRFDGEDRMRRNRWNILEPVGTEEVAPHDFDAVIVPAFGVGRNGHRVGHGRGFYDAFLAAVDAPKIGAVYAACFVDAVPAEPHDVPLDLVVTEREIWRAARS